MLDPGRYGRRGGLDRRSERRRTASRWPPRDGRSEREGRGVVGRRCGRHHGWLGGWLRPRTRGCGGSGRRQGRRERARQGDAGGAADRGRRDGRRGWRGQHGRRCWWTWRRRSARPPAAVAPRKPCPRPSMTAKRSFRRGLRGLRTSTKEPRPSTTRRSPLASPVTARLPTPARFSRSRRRARGCSSEPRAKARRVARAGCRTWVDPANARSSGRATVCLWTGDSNVSTTTGVCLSPAHGKKGNPCAASCAKNESCTFDLFTSPGYPTATCFEEDGLYCASGDNSMTCASIVPTGGDCAADSQACASTDYCDYSGSTPKCRTAATLGQSCSSSGARNCAQGMSLTCGASNSCEDLGFAYETTCGGTPPFPL